MTPQEKKELEYVTKTAFKVAIGIIVLSAVLFAIVNYIK